MKAMKEFTKAEIKNLNRVDRLNLINSLSGVKSACLVGTMSSSGTSNLAIFNSLIHIGSSPALLGFIVRPDSEVRRHTLENIREIKEYTINHFTPNLIDRAHYTSANLEGSEFEYCDFEEHFAASKAPFVKDSQLRIGLSLADIYHIKLNGTYLVIGQVETIVIDEQSLPSNYRIDFQKLQAVSVSGLNKYYKNELIKELPYARVSELPTFI